MKYVNKPIAKIDSDDIVTGKPLYLDDLAPNDCLIVKVVRSPYAHALIKSIDTSIAKKVPGIEAVYSFEDIPKDWKRYNSEGEEAPGQGALDRLVLDRHLRYVGDAVAIVAGIDETCVDKAIKLIKAEYEVLEPILDFEKALDNKVVIHPEDDYTTLQDVGADNLRNLCGHKEHFLGDVDKVMSDCDVVIEKTYHTKAYNQTPIEPFCAYAEMEDGDILHVTSATQVVFLIRRLLGDALNMPVEKIRVSKFRIGGGFGAKGSLVAEVYPAFVTLMTGKPSKIIYTREECFVAGSPRHEIKMRVKLGADKDGKLRAVDMYALSNAGAYAEHSPTVLDLALYISTSVYRNWEAFRLVGDVVYSNRVASGAYRGYGATQGHFAIESAVDEMAAALGMDPIEFRKINAIRENDKLLTYADGESAISCTANECLDKVRDMIDWDNKYPSRRIDNHTVRSVGVALCSQTTSIANNMTGSAILKSCNGGYELYIASGDIGTGSDTSIRQIAAETLGCDFDEVIVKSGDTANTIHDSGSYASASLYITGKAVEEACKMMKSAFANKGADYVEGIVIEHSFVPNTAPPPFLAGAVEIEIDEQTGKVSMLEYDAAVDCGVAINPTIVKAQVEGAAVQAFGMAHTEQITYGPKGDLYQNSLMQYNIPTRLDVGKLKVEIVSSHEATGPYGAKGVGEVGMNAMAPAFRQAVYNATGVWHDTIPITPEDIVMNN